MKNQLAACLLLAVPAGVLSAADSVTFPPGTYEAKGAPYTLSFDGKGQFRVNTETTLEVAGTYSVAAGELKLTDTSGPWACKGTGQSGTYRWTFEKTVLTLTKLNDQCAERSGSLVNLEWRQKN